ncbi:MAG: hypothetical protein WB502_15975 [Thermoactinomyces sp.]
MCIERADGTGTHLPEGVHHGGLFFYAKKRGRGIMQQPVTWEQLAVLATIITIVVELLK